MNTNAPIAFNYKLRVTLLLISVIGAVITYMTIPYYIDYLRENSPRVLPPEEMMLRLASDEYTNGDWAKYGGVSIAMIGDSNFEYEQDWNKLAGRTDIALFAISGFPAVYFEKLKIASLVVKSGKEGTPPRVAMMLGTNDIFYGVPPAKVKGSIIRIVTDLRNNGVEVTLVAVPYCGESRKWSKKRMLLVNSEIKELNELVTKWCEENGVQIFDINPIIAPKGELDPSFSIGDGLHLSEEGRNEIVKILVKVGQEVDQQPK